MPLRVGMLARALLGRRCVALLTALLFATAFHDVVMRCMLANALYQTAAALANPTHWPAFVASCDCRPAAGDDAMAGVCASMFPADSVFSRPCHMISPACVVHCVELEYARQLMAYLRESNPPAAKAACGSDPWELTEP